MLDSRQAFSGFAVTDTDAARQFYAETLGVTVTDARPEMGLLGLDVNDGPDILVYPKADHVPATYTVLNFPVADVEATVDWLVGRGVTFERYPGMEQDERGIFRGAGPLIAWFTDPSGNVLSVLQADG